MSTSSFVNALIGLARDYKTAERQARKRRSTAPTLGHEIAVDLLGTGYFPEAEVRAFGNSLDSLLLFSDPRRKA